MNASARAARLERRLAGAMIPRIQPHPEHSMIRGVKFASIPVTDQDRALAFYTEQLGFAVLTDQPFDDKQRWIELRIPGADTRVVLFTPDGLEDRIGTTSNIVFWAQDVLQTYRELAARGVAFDGVPEEQPWGTFATFRDPDGNQFLISSRN
jgi:catechol 2,3-dioxygenase-like lactoylglutathione lyase family enzyme